MTTSHKRTLTLGHSPDPDDAFMFYALAHNKIDTKGWRFEHILQDIQTLNERARRGELDITAVSVHAYPYVADQYALLSCGASMGLRYGPLVVAREPLTPQDLPQTLVAVPGTMTSAFLALRLAVGDFPYTAMSFDRIIDAVRNGTVPAGLIIHEGQLTYRDAGLHKVLDLGEWWYQLTRLPLPLGANVVRRDLGPEAITEIADILKASILYGLEHRQEAVAYALQWARDMSEELADRFVAMYVNELTLDYGPSGRSAVERFLSMAADRGFVPAVPPLEFF